jgi:hypothetical protein
MQPSAWISELICRILKVGFESKGEIAHILNYSASETSLRTHHHHHHQMVRSIFMSSLTTLLDSSQTTPFPSTMPSPFHFFNMFRPYIPIIRCSFAKICFTVWYNSHLLPHMNAIYIQHWNSFSQKRKTNDDGHIRPKYVLKVRRRKIK